MSSSLRSTTSGAVSTRRDWTSHDACVEWPGRAPALTCCCLATVVLAASAGLGCAPLGRLDEPPDENTVG